jgi:mRNA interferase RelE/StbE
MFNVEFSSKARKFLKKIDSETWKRLMEKIEKLRDDPFPSDLKRVIGRKEKTFRIRVGDYRILYIVFFDKNLLFISKIDKRSKVY